MTLNGSYSVSDVKDYMEHIIKMHEILSNNPPIYICINFNNPIQDGPFWAADGLGGKKVLPP